jgi:hypothetical protein
MTHCLKTGEYVGGCRLDAGEACLIISCNEKGYETRDERAHVRGGNEGIGREMSRCISVCNAARIQSERAYEPKGSMGTHRIATRLYASGKAGAGGGGVGAVNKASGKAMMSGGRAGRDVGALAGGVLDGFAHHGACMSSTRSGLVRRVLASSEAGSCTARVKRARSSGLSAAHNVSVEALSTTNVQHPWPN